MTDQKHDAELVARVDDRITAEKAEVTAKVAQAEKDREAAYKAYEKAHEGQNVRDAKAEKLDADRKPIPDKLREDIADGHKRVMRAQAVALNTSNLLARLADQARKLDDPKERDKRIRTAERFAKLRLAGEPVEDGDTPARMTGKKAAVIVLKQANGPLHYGDITRLALEGGLLKTGGKTPKATMNAMLSTGAKAGDTFVRVQPGVFDLAERATATVQGDGTVAEGTEQAAEKAADTATA